MDVDDQRIDIEWPRFSAYELTNGVLRPTPKSDFGKYRPWESYLIARRVGMNTAGPHEDLLKLVFDLRFLARSPGPKYLLEPQSAERTLEWCSTHGVLGVKFSGPSDELPHSSQSWRRHNEPFDDFVNAALELDEALRPFANIPDLERGSLDLVESLGGRASRVFSDGAQHSSLIELYWAMTLHDVLAGGWPDACSLCGTIFLTRSKRARYCSPTCRETAQKRAQRQRRRDSPGSPSALG